MMNSICPGVATVAVYLFATLSAHSKEVNYPTGTSFYGCFMLFFQSKNQSLLESSSLTTIQAAYDPHAL